MKAFFSILLFIAQPALAQTQYIFTRYSQDDGLASNKIQSITEDNRGFIWLTSEEGLTRFDGYTFKTYLNDASDSNSLPDNSILRLEFDPRGNLLVETGTGLSRYDARNDNFVRLLSFNDTSQALLFHNGIHNEEWVCTPRSLIELDAVSGHHSSYSLPKNFFIASGSNAEINLAGERLWISYDDGIFYFDLQKKKFSSFQFEDENDKPLTQLSHSRKNLLFARGKTFLLTQKGLFTFKEADQSFNRIGRSDFFSNGSNSFEIVFWSTQDYLLVSTFQGDVIKVALSSGKEEKIAFHSPGGEKISSLKSIVNSSPDDDGTVWLASDGEGLFHVDPAKNLVEQFRYSPTDANSISSNSVIRIYRDRSGVFWLACRGQGLVKMEKIQKAFTPFSISNNTSSSTPSDDQNVRAVCELDHDHLLIGTLGGLFSFSKIDSTITQVQLGEDVPAIGALFKDDEGKIWIGSWGSGKVFVLDPVSNKIISITMNSSDSSAPCKIIRAITEDKSKNIWIGTVCGLFEVNKALVSFATPNLVLDAKLFRSTDTNLLINSAVYSLLSDDKGRVLLIGTSDGLNILDESSGFFNKKFVNNKNDPRSLPTNNVRSLLKDHNGIIWAGTNGGGLSRLTSGTFITYTMKDGLPNDAIYSLQEDANGFLWLATNKGLCRFDPKNISCRNFKVADGLQNLEFNTNASYKTSEGELVFGGVKGFNYFNPKLIAEKNLQQPLTITSVKIFDHTIPFDSSEVMLAHHQNYLSFEFAARSHYRTQDNQYSYMLEGEDPDWIFAGNRRYASYTNLAPGRYVFHVRLSGSDSTSNSETSLPIMISPPWYKKPFAIFLFTVIAVLLLLLIFRLQRVLVTRRERAAALIKEAELKAQVLEEKNQSAQRELEKAKELEVAYNQLQSAKDQLVQQEKLASLGELTAGIAHEIMNPLNFVNNFSETSAEILEDLNQAVSEEDRKKISIELKHNLDKILKHSKRADSIVRNMLQHSRMGTGERQLTDINSLCEEFFNLSYHGMRANHRDFNCELEKKLLTDLPKVNVVSQDIGRVLLNLFNNAFHAVYEKEKTENASSSFRAVTENQYQPHVSVSTEMKNHTVVVKVRDNGYGIPDHIKQKIFEPFFTTKPTGVGTGLGLSLSYDIMKAHRGEIKVTSKEHEFTEFVITIPV